MCFSYLNKVIKKYKWWHISLLKLCVLAFALMIAKLWNGILILEWYWYLVFGIVLMIPLLIKFFSK